MENLNSDVIHKPNVREMIKIFSDVSNPIFLPKSYVNKRYDHDDVTNKQSLTTTPDDLDLYENISTTVENIYEEILTSDEDETEDQFGQYLNVPEIVDETKNFIREEENYCLLLEDLIENYINLLETDKFDVLDICGRVDLICAFQNNTFLPALKSCQNVSQIADCFIKHKRLFDTYYDSYFKNQPNMILVMQDNKDLFMASHSHEDFQDYEKILLKALNERIEAYQDFLESIKDILVENVNVTNFDRALEILKNLIQNFSPKDENIRYVISEIIETERKYVEKLGKITDHIIPKVKRLMKRKSQHESIIGNIPSIYLSQLGFYEDLKKCLFLFNPNEVADCFIQHKHNFMLYVDDQKMKDDPEAIDKCREILEKEHQKGIDFYVPLNRLYKYKLLLQELRKRCEKGAVPCDKVEDALNIIAGVISKMNGAAAINIIRDENIYLDDQGDLVLRNEFVVGDESGTYKAMVFLFEKSIVFTEIKVEGSNRNPRDAFLYKNHVIMKYMGMIQKEDSSTNFLIKFHGKTRKCLYELLAKDKATKDQWTTTIKDILLQQLQEEKQKNI